jgi:hypothetical protein
LDSVADECEENTHSEFHSAEDFVPDEWADLEDVPEVGAGCGAWRGSCTLVQKSIGCLHSNDHERRCQAAIVGVVADQQMTMEEVAEAGSPFAAAGEDLQGDDL